MPTSTAKLDTVVHHWDEDHSGYRNPTVIESLIIDNVIQLTPALVGTASEHCMHYYNTVPVVKWHYQMGSGVRPSVFLSVNRVPRPNSRTERPRKPKSGRIEVIKVIKLSRLSGHLMLRPKVRHILNFRTGGLQISTLYTDGARKPYHGQVPWPPRSKVKVTRSDAYDRWWPISRERNVPEIPKLVGSLPIPQASMRTSSRSKIKVTRVTSAESGSASYLRNWKAYECNVM